MRVSVLCGICARMDSAETVSDMFLGGANTKGRSFVGTNSYGKDTDEDTPANTNHVG